MRGAHRRFDDEGGQTLVEFAIVSILFFMTIFGTTEFGMGVWKYNLISNLAQEGARWAAVRGSQSLSPATPDGVEAFVRSRALGMTVDVTTTPPPHTVTTGATVSVRVQTTFTPLTTLIPSATLTLQSTAGMIMAR